MTPRFQPEPPTNGRGERTAWLWQKADNHASTLPVIKTSLPKPLAWYEICKRDRAGHRDRRIWHQTIF